MTKKYNFFGISNNRKGELKLHYWLDKSVMRKCTFDDIRLFELTPPLEKVDCLKYALSQNLQEDDRLFVEQMFNYKSGLSKYPRKNKRPTKKLNIKNIPNSVFDLARTVNIS